MRAPPMLGCGWQIGHARQPRCWAYPFSQLQQQCPLCRGKCIQQQRVKRGVVGDSSAVQQVEPLFAEFGASAPAINGAGPPSHQPTRFHPLDGAGQPTRAEPNHHRQPGHTLSAAGARQCA